MNDQLKVTMMQKAIVAGLTVRAALQRSAATLRECGQFDVARASTYDKVST